MINPLSSKMNDEGKKIASYWNRYWKNGNDSPWHLNRVNYFLEKHLGALTSQETVGLRFLVPLCGCSKDLLWLAEKGHSVFGVEICRDAVERFFEQNNLEYTFLHSNVTNESFPGNVFKAKTKDITIIQLNFFAFPSKCIDIIGGKFDAIWDRQSLVTYKDKQERKQYLDVIVSILAPNGKYMLEVFDYDPIKRGKNPIGPNRMSIEEFSELFTNEFKITVLEKMEFAGSEGPDPLPYDYELLLYLLTLKENAQE